MDVRTWGLARARLGRVGRRVAVLATVALVGSLAAASVSSAASEMPEALPGQATMSEAAIAAAIEDMGENERAQLEPRMKDRSIRPLGYKRAYFRFVTDPDGSTRVEPRMDVEAVANAIVYMDSLPLDANVQFMTVMATKIPFVGRG